jgi:serine/threonine protein kinase
VELAPGTTLARYRVERLLGVGGMGMVYLATALDSGEAVALKVVAPQFAGDLYFRQRFERESRLAAQIDDPHAVGVEDAGTVDGRLYAAMPYVDGTDLDALIASGGALEPQLGAWIVSQVASAIDSAHALGLVHRDVKPGNVLVESREGNAHAYLTDFGLAKHVSSTSGLTKTGLWVGTIDYAAPEQIQGGEVGPEVDVYALGCVLHEAVTGEVPYPRARDVAKISAHMVEPPPVPSHVRPELPPAFDAIVERAMAKAPSDRYPSAGELGRDALSAAGVTGPVSLGGRFKRRSPGAIDSGAPTVA